VKILLDECVPRKLRRELIGHEVKTVPEMGWASYSNGEPLKLAAPVFDVFVTVDRNLSFQQALPAFAIGVIVIGAPSNRLRDILPAVPKLLDALTKVKKGEALLIRTEAS